MKPEVVIDYTNWRGERGQRRIIPVGIRFGEGAPYHPGEQWLLLAYDLAKGQHRAFAMKDIHSWKAAE